MKRMRLSYFMVPLVAILGANLVLADHEVHHHKFVTVYKDKKNGLDWSRALHGIYTNGCIGADGEYDLSACTNDEVAPDDIRVRAQDSDAAKACKRVGGRLPTAVEFSSLIKDFDHREDEDKDLILTSKGRTEMQAVFGDMRHWFWSSSVQSDYSGFANIFSGGGGDVHYDFRESTYAVRCVSP